MVAGALVQSPQLPAVTVETCVTVAVMAPHVEDIPGPTGVLSRLLAYSHVPRQRMEGLGQRVAKKTHHDPVAVIVRVVVGPTVTVVVVAGPPDPTVVVETTVVVTPGPGETTVVVETTVDVPTGSVMVSVTVRGGTNTVVVENAVVPGS